MFQDPLKNNIKFDFEKVNEDFDFIDNTNMQTIYFNKKKKDK